jgi:hypothetical protein
VLGKENLELAVCWRGDVTYKAGCPPSRPDVRIDIDENIVSVSSILPFVTDDELRQIFVFASSIDDSYDLKSMHMHLFTFLCVVYETQSSFVYLQVVGQIARHIDALLPDIWMANPLDIQETVSSMPSKCRRDVVLGETLAMGEGCSDSAMKAKYTAQHIRSFLMFQPAAKRQKNLSPQEIDECMLLKYMQVQECTWPLVQHLSVGSDGIRVSSKDVIYFLMAGSPGAAAHVTGWGMRVTRITYISDAINIHIYMYIYICIYKTNIPKI